MTLAIIPHLSQVNIAKGNRRNPTCSVSQEKFLHAVLILLIRRLLGNGDNVQGKSYGFRLLFQEASADAMHANPVIAGCNCGQKARDLNRLALEKLIKGQCTVLPTTPREENPFLHPSLIPDQLLRRAHSCGTTPDVLSPFPSFLLLSFSYLNHAPSKIDGWI
jgi:hypothetical protein